MLAVSTCVATAMRKQKKTPCWVDSTAEWPYCPTMTTMTTTRRLIPPGLAQAVGVYRAAQAAAEDAARRDSAYPRSKASDERDRDSPADMETAIQIEAALEGEYGAEAAGRFRDEAVDAMIAEYRSWLPDAAKAVAVEWSLCDRLVTLRRRVAGEIASFVEAAR